MEDDNWGTEETLTSRVKLLEDKLDELSNKLNIANCKLDLMLAKQNEMISLLLK